MSRKIIEAEFVVLPVRDIGVVCGLALLIGQPVNDDADVEPEEIVDAPHPFGVAPRQVVVDRDDVHAAPGQRVEDRGQRRDEGLALAGFHLGDLALVQHHSADELDVEMTLAERALAGLAHRGKHRRQQVLHRLVLALAILDRRQRRLPFGDLRAQFVVGEFFELRFETVDLVHVRPQTLNFAVVLRAEDLPPY